MCKPSRLGGTVIEPVEGDDTEYDRGQPFNQEQPLPTPETGGTA
jgi:hypothetical protein